MIGFLAAVALLTTPAGGVDVDLTIGYVDGAGHRHRAALTCRGERARATGWLARSPVRACRRARRMPRPPGRNAQCTQIFGGPQEARITGRVGARRVSRTLNRRNGCKIAEWDAMAPLVPSPA